MKGLDGLKLGMLVYTARVVPHAGRGGDSLGGR
jgi:hypothetical protein